MDHQYQETTYHGPVYQTQTGNVYQSVENRNPWQTGLIRRLPVAGVLAMLGALVGMGGCAAILVVSDGQPIIHWKFQPTVYLAICSTLTNILLAFALSEGADIAWWRKASRERTTVADLHRVWDQGRSFKAALLSGRNVTLVAVACLLATIAQINSPLLQRASTVVLSPVNTNTKISFRAAQTVPDGFSGYVSGRGVDPTLYTPQFRDIVSQWNNNASISTNSTGCSGICQARVRALGIAVNCSSYQKSFSLIPKMDATGTIEFNDSSVQGIQIFSSDWTFERAGNATITVQYKNNAKCDGFLTVEQCNIKAADMEFPVTINGNMSTITLSPNTTVFDDKVGTVMDFTRESSFGPSTFGGFSLAMKNRFFSNATMRFTGAYGYTLLSTGNTALQYVNLPDTNTATIAMNCTTYFTSPMKDILDSARELMFRTSVAAATSTDSLQVVDGVDTVPHAIYRSNYYYLGGAILVTVLATFAIMFTYRGYSTLGRNPTMSPIEIAKAFSAPILQSHDSNAEADALIDEIGKRGVRYGAVQDSALPTGAGYHGDYKPYNPHVQEVNMRRRLVIGTSHQVQKPEVGETFVG